MRKKADTGKSIAASCINAHQRLQQVTGQPLLRFASLEQARACYADPAYTEAKAHALRAADRQLIIIEGELA